MVRHRLYYIVAGAVRAVSVAGSASLAIPKAPNPMGWMCSFSVGLVNPRTRLEVFERLKAHDPRPTTELRYSSPFELLVAVILSAQATDVAVNKITERLFAVAGTPAAMLRLGIDGLREHIKTIGLYNTKAGNIIKTSALLVEHHGGEVPPQRGALEALPGVGRKTANVVLNTAFDEPTIAVDTHIFRVANRTGLAPGRTPLAVEMRLMRAVPRAFRKDAHHWLILHGRYVCTARKPRCGECLIADLCEWPRNPGRPRRSRTRIAKSG